MIHGEYGCDTNINERARRCEELARKQSHQKMVAKWRGNEREEEDEEKKQLKRWRWRRKEEGDAHGRRLLVIRTDEDNEQK